MTIEELQAELAGYEDDDVSAAIFEAERDVLRGMIANPEVNVYLRGGCLKTLINLDNNEAALRNQRIASYEYRIATLGDNILPPGGM